MKGIIPSDSRYIPLTQQPACCVPTCIQMVMYRRGLPLRPAEEIGFYLGLTVHPDRAFLFYKVRTSAKRPPAGYGTQIYRPEYEPNTAFRKLGIPLKFSLRTVDRFPTPDSLTDYLRITEVDDRDILVCFHHGTLYKDPTLDWGHVCVFDRIVDGMVRIIDSAADQPKWRLVKPELLFSSMKNHGVRRSAGCWELSPL